MEDLAINMGEVGIGGWNKQQINNNKSQTYSRAVISTTWISFLYY